MTQNWWTFDEVLIKTILHSFLRHGVVYKPTFGSWVFLHPKTHFASSYIQIWFPNIVNFLQVHFWLLHGSLYNFMLVNNLFTNSKLHRPTGFRSVPKSVTLSDLERPTGRHFALFCTIRQLSELIASNSLKLDSYCRWQKCSPVSLVFGNTWLVGDDACYLGGIIALAAMS